MHNRKPDFADQQRQMALSRWDNEGGARREGPQKGAMSSEGSDIPELKYIRRRFLNALTRTAKSPASKTG